MITGALIMATTLWLLLMKGYSQKANARQTGRDDQTVRQHAAAVYRQASLSGRAELSGFFIEDLMLPVADRELHGADRQTGPARPARATP